MDVGPALELGVAGLGPIRLRPRFGADPLFGSARSAALDVGLRKFNGRLAISPPSRPGTLGPGVETSHEQLEREAAVTAAMDRLPAADRELISLKFFAGMDNNGIAEATGISVTNVGTRLHRAITKLRSACNEEVSR